MVDNLFAWVPQFLDRNLGAIDANKFRGINIVFDVFGYFLSGHRRGKSYGIVDRIVETDNSVDVENEYISVVDEILRNERNLEIN